MHFNNVRFFTFLIIINYSFFMYSKEFKIHKNNMQKISFFGISSKPKYEYEKVVTAIENSDINQLTIILLNIVVNMKLGNEKNYLLFEAAARGKLDIVKFLLKNGADARLVTQSGDTILARILSFSISSIDDIRFKIALEVLKSITDLNFLEKTLNEKESTLGYYNIFLNSQLKKRIEKLKQEKIK